MCTTTLLVNPNDPIGTGFNNMAARQSGEGSESETEESTPAFGGEDPSDAAHARKQGEEVGSVEFGFVTNLKSESEDDGNTPDDDLQLSFQYGKQSFVLKRQK